jgi:hypothetical protein
LDSYLGVSDFGINCFPSNCVSSPLTVLSQYTLFTPLDLYRYSDLSRELTTQLGVPVRDLSVSAVKLGENTSGSRFLSLDNGATALAYFATGRDNFQPSHWNPGAPALMGPFQTAIMSVYNLSAVDLVAFDAIGWDLRQVQMAPNPNPANSTILDLWFY